MSKPQDIIEQKKQRPIETSAKLFGIAHRAIPIIIITSGFLASSYDFAKKTGFDPALGQRLLGHGENTIYLPWAILVWIWTFFRRSDVIQQIIESLKYAEIFLGVGLFIALLMGLIRAKRHGPTNLHGTAELGTSDDLREFGLLSAGGVVLGQTDDAIVKTSEKSGKLVFDSIRESEIVSHSGNTHTLVIGPPRTGKLVTFVGPTLYSFRGSVIVYDTKGELWKYTAGERSRWSYALKFAPLQKGSVRINPMDMIRPDENGIRDAQIIVDGIAIQSEKDDPHFFPLGKKLAVAIVLHCRSAIAIGSKYRNLPGVRSYLAGATLVENGGEIELSPYSIFEDMIHARHAGHKSIGEEIREVAAQMMTTPEKELGSIMSTASRFFDVFKSPLVKESLSYSDFIFEDFLDADRPISLYLCVPNSDLTSLAPLFKAIVSLFIKRITEKDTSHDDMRMKTPVLIVLDELASLGPWNELESSMAVMPGSNVSVAAVFQSPSQIEKLYGDKHSFFDICRVHLVFTPSDFKSAKIYSDRIGKESVEKENTSISGEIYAMTAKNHSVSAQEHGRDLLNPDELMRLPKSEAFVFVNGMKPVKIKKLVYMDDSRFSHMTKIPAPSSDKLREECPNFGKLRDLYRWDELILNVANLSDGNPSSGIGNEDNYDCAYSLSRVMEIDEISQRSNLNDEKMRTF